MVRIRYAEREDAPFWFGLDRHIAPEEFYKKAEARRAYILEAEGRPAGLLRYNLFWDNTPFCTMLYIAPACQRKGYGGLLMERWEADMRAAGYRLAMTSTRSDESAQHFYRKRGYQEAGGLLLPACQPMELFFAKEIG